MASLPVPRDIYKQDVDFTALALQYADFAKRLKSNKQLDFSDPESIRQLTKALLLRDFNLSIELPEDRLCPPVPNRFNYIIWLQDLLDSTSDDFREKHDPDREVIGLDMSVDLTILSAS
jgi:23S rRNA (adenine1618-N6)-methyltransferase